MKRLFIIAILAFISVTAMAQENSYMVFFADKNNTQFDPYSYFDAKAIARYEQCGANLYDISNYPVNEYYVDGVSNYASEVYGQSRWLNAIGVMATAENAELIARLPYVDRVQMVASSGMTASVETETGAVDAGKLDSYGVLTDQVRRFGGEHFIRKGIDGAGLRICILDGGFPGVDEHEAFKHLRDNKQIIATYNFPCKKENVYGWNSHGTMVLSCIAGMKDGRKLGLATGAEFLLARTEIAPEPFKEEIWWAQGAEWADKNGADIINSSLGYGKDRYWTYNMDGTSYVAKAANTAVEKGILICNSAGNEGDDEHWMTIVTPSDAENVICVGGIEDKLNDYRHINFSSYGPTADKRLKPNVVAFGHATVANPKGGFTDAYGTSFASPLTAGFAACAWQTKRDLTAIQMKAEIEKSCDLYPYFDYAFGYGVPQASYFTGERNEAERSFTLVQEKDGVRIFIPEIIANQYVFINIADIDGVLLGYYQITPDAHGIFLSNKDLGRGKRINVSYNGFYDSCEVVGNSEEIKLFAEDKDSQNGTFKKVKKENWLSGTYIQYDCTLPIEKPWDGYNSHWGFGSRRMYGKAYKVGYGISINYSTITATDSIPEVVFGEKHKTNMRALQVRAELFQRIVIRRIGLNWDLGVYGGVNCTKKVELDYNTYATTYYDYKNSNRFQYGAVTRISYTVLGQLNLGIYGGFRLSDLFTDTDELLGNVKNQPSPWCIGVEVELLH